MTHSITLKILALLHYIINICATVFIIVKIYLWFSLIFPFLFLTYICGVEPQPDIKSPRIYSHVRRGKSGC